MHKKRRYRKKVPFILLLPVFLVLVCVIAMIQFDRKILPQALAISHLQAKSKANSVIDNSINETLENMEIKSSDFFIGNETGNIDSFSADTILINRFCTNVSQNIGKNLEALSDEMIEIPLGAVSGVYMFANLGPKISFTLMPMGESVVDYETSFTAVGINQTNFKIWINVNMGVQIVNPLIEEKVTLSRKLMLVDTVINGQVPESYLEFGNMGSGGLTGRDSMIVPQ